MFLYEKEALPMCIDKDNLATITTKINSVLTSFNICKNLKIGFHRRIRIRLGLFVIINDRNLSSLHVNVYNIRVLLIEKSDFYTYFQKTIIMKM